MKIFEWNFQQTFLIKFHEKWIQNGWAWPLFDTYHTHFSKTLLFRKWPLKPNKSWKFKKKFCIFGNHFIGLFNGILHVLIFWVVAEKQKDFVLGSLLIWNRLYVHSIYIDSFLKRNWKYHDSYGFFTLFTVSKDNRWIGMIFWAIHIKK